MKWIFALMRIFLAGMWFGGALLLMNMGEPEQIVKEASVNGVVIPRIIWSGFWGLAGGITLMEVGFWSFVFSYKKGDRDAIGGFLIIKGVLTHLITGLAALYLVLTLLFVLV